MATLLQSVLNKIGRDTVAASELHLDGRVLPVKFVRNNRARRIVLRMDASGTGIKLTVPPGIGFNQALEFAAEQGRWINAHLKGLDDQVAFLPGAQVPVRGVKYTIQHEETKRGTVWCDDEVHILHVAGDEPHIPRRVRDWLKGQARSDLTHASQHYANVMAAPYKRISIRDQQSRWGSCTENGHLSYSWRLILAPDYVLDYVAAHEVAHLREMNHSKRFWAIVEGHCEHMKGARYWLKKHGQSLHQYGA